MEKKRKKAQRPELPRIRRHRWKESGWLVLEPASLGMVVACFAGGLAAVVFFVRQQLGIPMAIADVVLGVAKTFVVSYVAVGLFVAYLLWVAERELTPVDDAKRRGVKGLQGMTSSEAPKPTEKAGGGTPSDLDVLTEALNRLGPTDEDETRQ